MVYPLPEVEELVRTLRYGLPNALRCALMCEVRPGVEEQVADVACKEDGSMPVYDHMDEYEAAEVQIKRMDLTTIQLLERGAVREQECDYCGSVPGEPCRFGYKKGVGSPIKGAHIARQFAALRAGWDADIEVLTYGYDDDESLTFRDNIGPGAALIDENSVDDLIGKSMNATPWMDLSDLIGR